MYYISWVIYIAFSLVLINGFMTAIFYSIIVNKSGPTGNPGLRGPRGEIEIKVFVMKIVE